MKCWLLTLCFLAGCSAFAETGPETLKYPPNPDVKFCQEMAEKTGEAIWRARMMGMPQKEIDEAPFRPGVPQWYQEVFNKWVKDIYAWPTDPDRWLVKARNECGELI